jgi:hypothetical protein
MATSSRPIGLRSTPELAIPQYANWTTELRTVSANDASPADVNDDECIALDKVGVRDGSRFSNNTIALLVKVITGPATISLYAREGVDHFLVADPITLTTSQMVVFGNLPPLIYVPVVTSLTGSVIISGGGTL